MADAEDLLRNLSARGAKLVLAESCTAGLAADLLACIPGASRVLWGSFICYTEDAKAAMLGLDRKKIEQYGAVSRETACAMAEGALAKSGAFAAGAVTGLAGPDGDGSGLPLGTVWIASALKGGLTTAGVFHFSGSRNEIRRAAADCVIGELLKRIPT
jgi:PncC family amidohydrolase